jgi:Flp pilus assembly protein TadD
VCLGRPEDARRSFAQSLAIDPNQPKLHAFLRAQ